jgi:hypothetical protein
VKAYSVTRPFRNGTSPNALFKSLTLMEAPDTASFMNKNQVAHRADVDDLILLRTATAGTLRNSLGLYKLGEKHITAMKYPISTTGTV